jgi:hypothetical protein
LRVNYRLIIIHTFIWRNGRSGKLARIFILSESRGTHDHVLLSRYPDSRATLFPYWRRDFMVALGAFIRARCSWLRHYATSQKVTGSSPDEVIGCLNSPNHSSCTMALGSTQPLTEMSTRNHPEGIGRPARKADNLTAICEPFISKIWEPRPLTTIWASTASYRDTFLTLPWRVNNETLHRKRCFYRFQHICLFTYNLGC